MTDQPPKLHDAHLLETGRLAELGLHSAELVHELRQPLFAAKSLVQLLLADLQGPSADLARAMGQLRLVSQQLAMLEGLVSRYGGAGRRPEDVVGPILLAPPVTAAVQMFDGRAQSRGVELELEISSGEQRVVAERVAVQQVIGNLVQNALDAADSAVVVRVAGPVVEVRDDGPDLPQDVLERLFEPFFTTKPPGKGTGLGLAVARQLMRGFGGELDLRRHDGCTVLRAVFRTEPPPTGTASDAQEPPDEQQG